MSCNNQYYFAEDCPNCGQKDEYGKYKGARQGNGAWGHTYMCCSEKCGREFLNSKNHIALEVGKIKDAIESLQRQLRFWEQKR